MNTPSKTSIISLVLVTFIVSWGLLLFNLGSQSMMFDEKYYVSAAKDFLAGTPTTNPEHPPVAKYFIAAGMRVLGDNPWGWRIMGTLFGAVLVVVILLWVLELTGSRSTALIAAALLVLNNFWFVMSRVAMLSIFGLTFSAIGLYLYTLSRTRGLWIGYSGLAFGLAVGCRWNAGAMLFVIGILCLVTDKSVRKPMVLYAAAASAYALSFIPLMVREHDAPSSFVGMQVFMLGFHKHAVSVPGFSEAWYNWIFRTHPQDSLPYLVGNPAITVFGILALAFILYRRDKMIVAMPYLVNLGFWVVTPRPATYYYYYLDAFVFLAPAIAVACWQLGESKKMPFKLAPVAVASALVWFVSYYGVMAGFPAPWNCILGCH